MTSLFSLLTLIVLVALATSLITHPETVQLVNSAGNVFTSSLKTATTQ